MNEAYVQVENLKKYFPCKRKFLSKSREFLRAVDGVNFSIPRGKTFGLVGESGCGKSTVGKLIMGLIPPSGGSIRIAGTDILELKAADFKAVRRDVQIVFQDPFGSLNPNLKIRDILSEPFITHTKLHKRERSAKVRELLEVVGLDGPDTMDRYPHEFSGGQRQRICIARAIALYPKFVICDEAVSALDVSVQAQILNLLESLQQQLGITYLFISHNLGVIRHISDYVGVMYLGKIVESAVADDLFGSCRHPYTEALITAIPQLDSSLRKERALLSDEVPDILNMPGGCAFHPRCPRKTGRCLTEDPLLRESGDGRRLACHNPIPAKE